MIPFCKLIHIDSDGDEKDLYEYLLDFNISKGTEAKKNTITINLFNFNNDLDSLGIEVDESTIKVYLDWQPITTQDPVISATVNAIDWTSDNSGKPKVKIKATDKTGLFLSKLWAQAILESDGVTADAAVKQIIGHLNGFTGSGEVTTNNVATTKSNGLAFDKNVNIAKTWKPGYEWLNELSQPEYTNDDRPYVYWIDENNDLHWRYPYQKPITTLSSAIDSTQTTVPVTSTSGWPTPGTIAIDSEIIYYTSKTSNSFTNCTRAYGFSSANAHVSGSLVNGQTLEQGKDDILKIDMGTSDEGTYNFIIYNAGETPQGYEYLDYTLDFAAIGKKFKMKFFDWKDIANSLTDTERRSSSYGDSSLAYPSTYPYTTTWDVTVASDSEYQDAFISELVVRAENKANAFFMTGQQRYKASIQMRGNLNFQPNELVTFVSPNHSQSRLLRIKDIKHQLNRTGWITDISAETDPEATII
jgi:hypothetical protein